MDVFTQAFALEFLNYLTDIKIYIDTECTATLDDLKKRFKPD